MTELLDRPAPVRARRPVVPRQARAVPGGYVPPAPPRPPAPRVEPRVAFRGDVEGLRGVAVLLVVLYHAGVPRLPGGFVGVDAFFVVSGYVITTLLVAEVRLHDGVSLAGFYARRCRRILPAAGFVLVATVAAGAVLLPPLRRVDLARDVLACALYGGNWHFVALQTDYLRAGGDPSPVLHYWSLGVEEQFYLLWPFVFVAALALARRLRAARTVVLAAALTVLTAASFALALHWTTTSAPLAYLSSPSRGWQFAVGAWLALLLPVAARLRSRGARAVRSALGLVGAGALGAAAATFGESGYPGTLALVPTLGTAALLAAGCELPDGRGPLVSRVLSGRVLRRLGLWSFTWYLWHWPAIVLVAARYGELTWPVRLAVAVAALGPAALTTRWLERPLRRSAVVGSRPRVGIALGVSATLLPLGAAVLLGAVTLQGMDARVGGAAAGTVDRGVVRFDDSLRSGPVRPSPLLAAKDVPASPADCFLVRGETANGPCLIGRPAGPAGAVVLLGDSHAEQWLPAVQDLADAYGTAVLELGKAGCPAADIRVERRRQGTLACDRWREATLRRLETGPRPALVVVSSYNGYLADSAEQARAWRPTLRRLSALGAPVVYVADTPKPTSDVPACVSGALDDWSRCSFPRSAAFWPDPTARDIAAGRWPGVHLVDLDAILCPDRGPGARCPAVRGGVLLYRDASHLTGTAVSLLSPQLVASVLAQVPAPAEAGPAPGRS